MNISNLQTTKHDHDQVKGSFNLRASLLINWFPSQSGCIYLIFLITMHYCESKKNKQTKKIPWRAFSSIHFVSLHYLSVDGLWWSCLIVILPENRVILPDMTRNFGNGTLVSGNITLSEIRFGCLDRLPS